MEGRERESKKGKRRRRKSEGGKKREKGGKIGMREGERMRDGGGSRI